MDDSGFENLVVLYDFSVLGVSIWYAFEKNKRMLAANPKALSYRWGYFWGITAILFSPAALIVALFELGTFLFGENESPFSVIIGLFFIPVFVALGWGIIQKYKEAWIGDVLLIAFIGIFTMNPIIIGLAFGNGIYAYTHRDRLQPLRKS